MNENSFSQQKMLKIVTAKEMGNAFIAQALNLRFTMFMVRVAEHYDLNGHTFFSEMREILESAEIPQEV